MERYDDAIVDRDGRLLGKYAVNERGQLVTTVGGFVFSPVGESGGVETLEDVEMRRAFRKGELQFNSRSALQENSQVSPEPAPRKRGRPPGVKDSQPRLVRFPKRF